MRNEAKKIHLTGSEPLLRQGVAGLCARIAALLRPGEGVMTTNGAQLAKQADALAQATVSRLNISPDKLDLARLQPSPALGIRPKYWWASRQRAKPVSPG